MNFKDELQGSVEHWLTRIEELIQERIDCENRGVMFTHTTALAEYKGRIYATRQIVEMLGIDLDTNFKS